MKPPCHQQGKSQGGKGIARRGERGKKEADDGIVLSIKLPINHFMVDCFDLKPAGLYYYLEHGLEMHSASPQQRMEMDACLSLSLFHVRAVLSARIKRIMYVQGAALCVSGCK